jgi:hypothetical protein
MAFGLPGFAQTTPPSASEVQQSVAPLSEINWQDVRKDSDTIELRGTFPSSYATQHPENQTVPAILFLPANPKFTAPYPIVITLHYLGASNLDTERSLAHQLNRRGIAAAALVLPFHMSRATPDTTPSALLVDADPMKLDALMVQGVQDTRRLLDQVLLRPDVSKNDVGIAGVSLGSLIAEMVYGVDPRVTHAAFILGGENFAHILWHSSVAITSRRELRAKGFNEQKLAEAVAPVEPKTYLETRVSTSPPAKGSLLVVGGRFDTVMPVADTKALITTLGNPPSIWLDTGHYGGVFIQRRMLGEVANFFEDFSTGQTFTPPTSVRAPTLRLFAQGATPTGFDIGVGYDVFRTREQEPIFGSFALTIHGPEFIIAKSLGQGIAIGGGIGLKGPGVGIYWSTIL